MASRGKGGKRKGSGFERLIAKKLSDWSGLEVRRTPGSGGFDKTTFPGDVYSSKGFPLCVECKDTESWNFKSLFKFDGSVFDAWWTQVTTDTVIWSKTNDEPLLPIVIFSKNYFKEYALFDSRIFDRISNKEGLSFLIINKPTGCMYLTLLDSFLSCASLNDFKVI